MSERLDRILARNRRVHWSRNPVVRAVVIAVLVVLAIALAVCTDLGQGKVPGHAAGSAGSGAGGPAGPRRVDDVYLGRPRAGSAAR